MTDNDPGQEGGGRLRWYQQQEPEGTKSRAPRWYTDPAARSEIASSAQTPAGAALVEHVDIGDALEAEAQRRSALEMRHREHGWFIQGTYAKRNRIFAKRLAVIFAVTAAAELALYAVTQLPAFLWITFGLAIYFGLLYLLVSRTMRSVPAPEVGVSPVGISVVGRNYSGMLRWDEIESVERRAIYGTRMIMIKPKDPTRIEHFTYSARGVKMRQVRRRLSWIYGKLPEAVYIDETTLPMTPEAFLARAAADKAAAVPAR